MTLTDDMRRLTQHLLGAHRERREAVASIRTGAAQQLAESHGAHGAMSTEQRRRLSDYTDELRQRVDASHRDAAAFLEEAGATREAMSTEQRRRLSDYMGGLRQRVDALHGDAVSFLEDVRAAREAMSAEQRRRLGEGRASLAADVADMRGGWRARRRELRADQDEARRVWSSLATLLRQRRAERPQAPPPAAAARAPSPVTGAPAEEAPPSEAPAPDDLTAIRGIGPGMQRHLNAAGIHTYTELAQSTPEGLQEALGDAGRLAKVEEWIEAARQLAGLG